MLFIQSFLPYPSAVHAHMALTSCSLWTCWTGAQAWLPPSWSHAQTLPTPMWQVRFFSCVCYGPHFQWCAETLPYNMINLICDNYLHEWLLQLSYTWNSNHFLHGLTPRDIQTMVWTSDHFLLELTPCCGLVRLVRPWCGSVTISCMSSHHATIRRGLVTLFAWAHTTWHSDYGVD
jgi:hypothetical protein